MYYKMIQEIVLYYNTYESEYGDGYYPHTSPPIEGDSESTIKFDFVESNYGGEAGWKQNMNNRTQHLITGLDGDAGKDLLIQLNTLSGKEGKFIRNGVGLDNLYPKSRK